MEASTITTTAGLAAPRTARITAGPLLRLRSDEQLVRLFRSGSEEAFRVIHDRYRPRLFAYARQMLAGSRQDAEDALQDVFVRAYGALRANDREVSLRAWLYRIAHNRCIDELRRPPLPPPETFELIRPPASDPIAVTEQRESLRRLVEDVRRLPEQQRSALLMREISGMSYDDLASALDVTVPAVKSLLVRARIGLAQAAEARDTACVTIREELADAHDRGVRASGLAKRHLHDCESCRAYKRELRVLQRRFAALTPALGPGALLMKLLGVGGGAAGGASAAGGGAAAGGGVAVGGGVLGVSVSHVAAVVAVAVVSAGGAVEVQQSLLPTHHRHARAAAAPRFDAPAAGAVRSLRVPGATAKAHPGPAAKTISAPAAPKGTVVPVAATTTPVAPPSVNGGAPLPPELADDPPPTATTPPAAADTPTPVTTPTDSGTSSPPTATSDPPPSAGAAGSAGSTAGDPAGQQASASAAPSAP